MKNILVIGPILPQWTDIKYIEKNLDFLKSKYKLDYYDPLNVNIDDMTYARYSLTHKEVMNTIIDDYDILVGFSMGGVLLQSFFDLEKIRDKKIILFSTPAFSHGILSDRLGEIVKLIENASLIQALEKLHHYVFYPHAAPVNSDIENESLASARLAFGFNYVISADNRNILKHADVSYLHFIGSQSLLVTQDHLVHHSRCHLLVVPESGMRVLQDNINFCAPRILNYLEG